MQEVVGNQYEGKQGSDRVADELTVGAGHESDGHDTYQPMFCWGRLKNERHSQQRKTSLTEPV